MRREQIYEVGKCEGNKDKVVIWWYGQGGNKDRVVIMAGYWWTGWL